MNRRVLPSPTFLALLSLGPLFWLTYYLYVQPRLQLLWPGREPIRFMLLVLVYPVLEELVFRGLVLEWLGRQVRIRWGVLSLANVMTSLLFAALHLIHQSLLWSALVFWPSLLFGYAKERYQTLWAPIILHGWFNLGFIWLFRPL